MRRLTLVLIPVLASAQYSGNVLGVVRDTQNRPVSGASIVLVGPDDAQNRRSRTTSSGTFLINHVPVAYPHSIYSVVATLPGFEPQVIKNIHVLPGAVMASECEFVIGHGDARDGLLRLSPPGALFRYTHEREIPVPGRLREGGQIFATREGLTGRTTANGHVIRTGDRFVALPSRRALNKLGERRFQVKVRQGGSSAIVPVWDIGPWNIKDDYWNSPADRESFRDLPHGLPQAQAAYLRKHNGGKDAFGRKVLNPAGIDLSDAVFWRDLGMRDNGWVSVEYLWNPDLISTREPTRAPSPGPRSGRTRGIREILAIAEAILLRTRW